jgi:VWFA-related protein
MFTQRRLSIVLFFLFCGIYADALFAQQNTSLSDDPKLLRRPDSLQIMLDVVAANADGPVNNLAQQNFTVLIDKKPVPISDFHSVTLQTEQAEPVEIVLVVDEVNTPFASLNYARGQIRRFLEQNAGKLKHPVRLAFLSRSGCEIQADSSSDGNAVLAAFDQHAPGLQTIHSSSVHLTLVSLRKIVAEEAKRPGRKLVVWIGSGWPISADVGGVEISAKERHRVFEGIIFISTALRQARITLYCVSAGGADSSGTHYEAFLKPVTTVGDTEEGNVNMQVLAVQSGGLVLKASNDVSAMLEQCMADADSFYTLTIMAPLTGPEKFHKIEVKTNTSGTQVRTRYGYYG